MKTGSTVLNKEKRIFFGSSTKNRRTPSVHSRERESLSSRLESSSYVLIIGASGRALDSGITRGRHVPRDKYQRRINVIE